MHIAGDQHQVAGRCPIISGQNDPLGRTRPQYFLAFASCNCLMQACHVIGRTLTSRHLDRMDGWVVSVLDRYASFSRTPGEDVKRVQVALS